ncbi:MarR family winged helix-turn-helix transcriptional regulator [Streptacidiphilus griseoplanus]|uniref:MarR family winged helix-turn-helix transcriptional regulator n=1 Tax=Peterkaempfera griseoplana TaxID=66896 RepID=UPI0006E3C5FF|nr:MarR family winged helix-turn-helix transcriptional regulator [Peterkaempfera griseoplana]
MSRKRALSELSDDLRGVTLLLRRGDRTVPVQTRAAVAMLATLCRQGEMRMVELSECLLLDMSVVSRRLAHLEEFGLAVRRPNPADGRSCLISATRAGRRMVADARRARAVQLADATDGWDDTDLDSLARLLRRLHTDLGLLPPQAGAGHGPDWTPTAEPPYTTASPAAPSAARRES